MKIIIPIFFVLSVFWACDSKNEPNPNKKETETINLSAVQKQRVHQDNNFSFELLRSTIEHSNEENILLSPMSASMALGMVLNGANGNTQDEIRKVINMENLTREEINTYYKLMLEKLPVLDKKTNLKIANAIWLRNDFQTKTDFLKKNRTHFNAYIKAIDFNQQWAVDTINDWASRNTNGLIPKVIKSIPPLTMLYIMNALYFKGDWVKQFDKNKTKEFDFEIEKGESTKVNMMLATDTFLYASDDHAQYLTMPYGNGAFSMAILLPTQENNIHSLLENIDANRLDDIFRKMKKRKVHVGFPRFKVKQTFNLKNVLKDMGMNEIFNKSLADLTGISDMKPLFVSSVQQDAYVEVTEEGTEAAAVTTISVGTSFNPNESLYFVANRPFVFLIRENSTGAILFIGKMGNVEKF